MISRRHIRIKVMQSVYALSKSGLDDVEYLDFNNELTYLQSSIDSLYSLYLLNLDLFGALKKLALSRIEKGKNKLLSSSKDKNPNLKFVNNKLLCAIKGSSTLQRALKNRSLEDVWNFDNHIVSSVLESIYASDVYCNYMETKHGDFKIDKDFIVNIFKQVIAPNEKLNEYFEEKQISWSDDIPFVNTWILKNIKNANKNLAFRVDKLYKDNQDKLFVIDLFKKTLSNSDFYEKEIKDKTPNWELQRIAQIDLILIKMALCEFMYFKFIPVRVTINEYIEISKDYSTDKSSIFINGVLDRIQKELSLTKRINKIDTSL